MVTGCRWADLQGARFLDNPGDPANWSNSYTQYIAEAAWRSTRSTVDSRRIAANLAKYAEGRRQGRSSACYDHDNNGTDRVRLGCADRQRRRCGVVPLSARGRSDRTESAYIYSGALAARAGLRRGSGNASQGGGCTPIADPGAERGRQRAVESRPAGAEHRHVASNSPRPVEGDQHLLPVRGRPDAQHGHVPGVRCGCSTIRPSTRRSRSTPPTRRTRRLRPRPASWAATTSPPSTRPVQFRLFSSGAAQLPQPAGSPTDDYKKLLYWNAWAQYVGGNTQWPDANEFWARLEPASLHHLPRRGSTTTSSAAATGPLIEDVAGSAAAQRQQGGAVARSTSAGRTSRSTTSVTATADLTVVWDEPG